MSDLADFIGIITGIMTILGIGGVLTWRKIGSTSASHSSYQVRSQGQSSKSKEFFAKSLKLFVVSFIGVLISALIGVGLKMENSPFLGFIFFISFFLAGGASVFFFLKAVYYWIFG